MPQRFHIHEHYFSHGDFSIKDDSGKAVYNVRSKFFTIGDKLLLEDAAGNPLKGVSKIVKNFFPSFQVMENAFVACGWTNFFIPHHLERRKTFIKSFSLSSTLPLIKIRQENLPRYSILSAQTDQELAVIKKIFSFFHPKFVIESIFGEYILKSPEIISRSFMLEKNEKVVASVSKKLSTFSDSYGIEILDDSEDCAFILAVVIVLDQYLFDRN